MANTWWDSEVSTILPEPEIVQDPGRKLSRRSMSLSDYQRLGDDARRHQDIIITTDMLNELCLVPPSKVDIEFQMNSCRSSSSSRASERGSSQSGMRVPPPTPRTKPTADGAPVKKEYPESPAAEKHVHTNEMHPRLKYRPRRRSPFYEEKPYASIHRKTVPLVVAETEPVSLSRLIAAGKWKDIQSGKITPTKDSQQHPHLHIKTYTGKGQVLNAEKLHKQKTTSVTRRRFSYGPQRTSLVPKKDDEYTLTPEVRSVNSRTENSMQVLKSLEHSLRDIPQTRNSFQYFKHKFSSNNRAKFVSTWLNAGPTTVSFANASKNARSANVPKPQSS